MLNVKQPRLIAAGLGAVALAVTASVFVFKGPAPKKIEPVGAGRFSRVAQSGMDLGLSDHPAAERHQYTLVPPEADSTDMVRRSQWGPYASEEGSSAAQTLQANGQATQEEGEAVPEAPGDADEETAPGPAGSGFKLQDQDIAGKTGAASGASSSFSTPVSAQPEGALERMVAAAGQAFNRGKNSIVRSLGGGSRQATRPGQLGNLKKQSLATTPAGGAGDGSAGSKSRMKGFGLEDEGGGPGGGGDDGGLIDCPAGMKPMMTGKGANPWKCESMKDKNDELARELTKDKDGEDKKRNDGGEDNNNKDKNGDKGGGDEKADKGGEVTTEKTPEETPVLEETTTTEETPIETTEINNVNVNVMTQSWSEAAQVIKDGAVKNCQVVNGKSTCVGKENQPQEVSTEVAITEIRESAKTQFQKGTMTDCKSAGGGKYTCVDSSSRKDVEVNWAVWGAYADTVDKNLAAANQKVEEVCHINPTSECRNAKREQSNAQQKMDVLMKNSQASQQQTNKGQTTTSSPNDKKNQGDAGSGDNQAVALLDNKGTTVMNVKTNVCDQSQGFYKIGAHCQQVGTTSMAAFPDKKSPTGFIFMTPAACAADKKYEFRVTNSPGPGHGVCVLKNTTTTNNSTSNSQTTTKTNTAVGGSSTQKTTTDKTGGSSSQKNSASQTGSSWNSLNSASSGGGFSSKNLGNNTTVKKDSSGGTVTVTDPKKVTGKCSYAGQKNGKNTWTCPN